MANMPMDIPWHKLVSNLTWSTDNHGKNPDIRLLSKPTTESDLSHFTGLFIENIQKGSQPRHTKTPSYYTRPESEEIIITDAIVEKISPTVRRTFRDLEFYFGDTYAGGDELIPQMEREAFSFLRPYDRVAQDCGHADGEDYPVLPDGAFYNAEMVKILLLHGEMDAIMRICTDEAFLDVKWWAMPDERDLESPVVGWNHMFIAALRVYIGLHALRRLVPSRNSHSPLRPYRNTRAYQYLLRSCTITRPVSMVATLPHREFFGIADWQLNMGRAAKDPETQELVDETAYGVLSFSEFLAVDGWVDYIPSVLDVRVVKSLLGAMGLPMELVLSVMDSADYSPRAKLVVSHDPLHPLNSDILEEHLGYCWDLLVRCDMVARAWKRNIDWEAMVRTCILGLFNLDAGSGNPL